MATVTQHHHLLTPSPWWLWFQQKKKIGEDTFSVQTYEPENSKMMYSEMPRERCQDGSWEWKSPISLPSSRIDCHIDENEGPVAKTLCWWSQTHSCLCTPWLRGLGWAGLRLVPVKQNCWGACGLAISACFIGWEDLLPGITLSLMVRGPGPKRKSCDCHGVPMMLRKWPVIKGLGWKEKTVCTEVIWPTVETVMSQRAGVFTTAAFAALKNGK